MAEVEMGMMQVKIPLIDLVVTKEPIQTYKKSVNTDMVSGMQRPETKIDLREYTKSDALHFLQEFLDRALLNNLHELKIIHGVGTGVLKKEVHKMLREYKDIKKVWHPEPELGGEGVTYVQL
jgi:DNA mismatch repair protein MutS2